MVFAKVILKPKSLIHKGSPWGIMGDLFKQLSPIAQTNESPSLIHFFCDLSCGGYESGLIEKAKFQTVSVFSIATKEL